MNGGLIQIYTGEGKGKTTASVGLSVRAAGRGLKVLFAQYLKSGDSGEVNILGKISGLDYMQVNKNPKFLWKASEDDRIVMYDENNNSLDVLMDSIKENKYDLIIMDEMIHCINKNIVDINKLRSFLESDLRRCEVVLTGRDAPGWLIDIADLVTEMKAVKHPYSGGMRSREGIEY